MNRLATCVSALVGVLILTCGRASAQSEQDAFVLEGLGRAIEARPDDAGPLVKRGMYYLWRTFEYGKALDDFDRALAIDPNNVVAYIGRADVYTGRDARYYDPQKALADTTKAIELDPMSSDAYRMRGDLPGHPGFSDYGNALKDYEKAIELNPENMLAYMGLAYNYAKEDSEFHDDKKALQYARKAVDVAPDESLAIEALGDLLASKPETYDEALLFLNRAVQLNRRNAGSLLARGYLYLIQAMDEEMLDIFGALREQDLSLADIVKGNDKAFRKALDKLGEGGLLSRALSDFKEAQKLCPHNDDVFKAQAFAVQNFPGQERQALEYYTRAAELNKFSADNYIDRIEFLLQHPELAISPNGLPESASEGIDPALLAELIAKNLPKLTAELIGDCGKALAIEPDSDQAHYLLGTLLATQGKYAEAIESLDKALELAPGKAEYYEARASVHETFGRDEESQADLERASDLESID